MGTTIGSSTSANASSLIRSLKDQSENTRTLVTSNGGLTKPTRTQPPTTQVLKLGSPPDTTKNATTTQTSSGPGKLVGDSLRTSMAGRSKMLSASAQALQSSSNAQIVDTSMAAAQTTSAAKLLSGQPKYSLSTQANATPSAAMRLLA